MGKLYSSLVLSRLIYGFIFKAEIIETNKTTIGVLEKVQ